MERYAHLAYVAGAGLSLHVAHQVIIWAEINDRVVFLRQNATHALPQSQANIDTWDTKYTPQDVHDTILTTYQNRRIIDRHDNGEFNSVNPMSSVEVRLAVDDLTKAFRTSMPTWLVTARQRVNANDRLFCGASSNGGIINLLSRSCNKTDIDLYTARSHLYSTYTGASDEYLGRSFPVPRMVLPKLIIAHALLNALDLRFLRYLPHTNPSYGILLSEEFFSGIQSSESNESGKEKILFMDKPWNAVSRNPHVSQHLSAHADSILSSKARKTTHRSR
uniref:Uncharacterized protein n=1 Tax=Paramoeba aestuarina TaxID=180227 RepID=A0A7S4K724_9EUKA